MHHYLVPLFKKNPTNIVVHCGTDDALDKSPEEIVGELIQLKMFIEVNLPTTSVILSFPTIRNDNHIASAKISKLRTLLNELRCVCVFPTLI